MEKAQSENNSQSMEDVSIDEDQAVDSYLKQITQDNFQEYLQTAKDMKKEQDYNEAMYLFRALIEKGTEIYNSEININLSQIYFHIGDCILAKLEEQDDELFGGEQAVEQYKQNNGIEQFINEDGHLDKEAFQQSLMQNVIQKIQNNELQLQFQQDKVNEPSEQDLNQEQQNQEEEDDQEQQDSDDLSEIQLAWENIETARVILVKYLDEQTNLKEEDKKQFLRQLADYVLRLGDVENKKEQFDKAIEEYQTSLQILQQTEDVKRSRRIAEVYFLMGNSYLYLQQGDYLENALENFQKGESIIKNLINEEKDKEKLTEFKDLLKVFQTKVYEVTDEIQIIETLEQEKELLQKKDIDPAQQQQQQQFGQSMFNQQPQKLGTFNNKENEQQISKNKKISEQIKINKLYELTKFKDFSLTSITIQFGKDIVQTIDEKYYCFRRSKKRALVNQQDQYQIKLKIQKLKENVIEWLEVYQSKEIQVKQEQL